MKVYKNQSWVGFENKGFINQQKLKNENGKSWDFSLFHAKCKMNKTISVKKAMHHTNSQTIFCYRIF